MTDVNTGATNLHTSTPSRSSPVQRVVLSTGFVMWSLLATSVILNVFLASRIRQLHVMQVGQGPLSELHIGVSVPPLAGKWIDGKETTIVYEGTNRPTVLYIFRPQCIWCARNFNNVKALVAAKGGESRFIAVTLSEEGLAKYLTNHQLNMPILTGLSPETIKAYSLGATPQTLVVSPQGRVMQNWPGAWTGKQKSEVEAFFHVKLPGLDWTASAPPVERRSAVTEKIP